MVHEGKQLSLSQPDLTCYAGEWRRPYNDLREQRVGGGHKAIHDDETAAKVGFRTAPIHGTVHWSQFTPLMLHVFGKSWFESGSISVHFRTPVSHLQPVRAFCSNTVPKERLGQHCQHQQIQIWMELQDGDVVFEGTASVGLKPDQIETMAKSKILKIKPYVGELVFVRHAVGTRSRNVETARIDFHETIGPLFPFTLAAKLEYITEWHPWFALSQQGSSSPWGRPILPPEMWNALMLGYCGTTKGPEWPALLPHNKDARLTTLIGGHMPVALFGGCEVILHKGPIFEAETYEIIRILIAKGETPKTEFSWVRTILKHHGVIVAEMTLQTMYLKASVEGYDKLRAMVNAKASNSLSKL